jgi:two-component sensor histidine kinase
LLLNELATNAAKYGAWRTDDGFNHVNGIRSETISH